MTPQEVKNHTTKDLMDSREKETSISLLKVMMIITLY
jgi:hypothetical protein